MNTKIIKNIIKEENPNAVMLNDFEEALIGTGKVCGRKPVAAYNTDEILKILIKKNNIGEIEAYEIFQSTIKDAFPDVNDPIFINDFRNIVNPEDILNISETSIDDTIDKIDISHK